MPLLNIYSNTGNKFKKQHMTDTVMYHYRNKIHFSLCYGKMKELDILHTA